MIDLHIIEEDLDTALNQERRLLDALAAVRERITELRDELVTETNRHLGYKIPPAPYNGYRRRL